jgi:hypothetical protein
MEPKSGQTKHLEDMRAQKEMIVSRAIKTAIEAIRMLPSIIAGSNLFLLRLLVKLAKLSDKIAAFRFYRSNKIATFIYLTSE